MFRRVILKVMVPAAILIVTPILADTVTLRDGTIREGVIVAEDDQTVTMELRMGGLKGRIVIPRHEIASLKSRPLPPDPVETAARKLQKDAEGKAGKEAADAWVALGDLYAKHNGYSAQARAAYEKAIAADPDHTKARHGLGHVKTSAGWQATNDLRRERGLVPLGQVWVKPDERSWIIDKRHAEQTDELRIGPRQPDDFTKQNIEKELALKRAQDEARRAEAQRMARGDTLLSRYGYMIGNDPHYIGGTPVWADGVGVSSSGYSAFFGRVGTGWYPYSYPRTGYGHYGHGHSHGYSPGFKWGNFSFGTSLNPYGHGYGGYSGWGAQIKGGSGSTNWRINIGGSSSSYRSSSSTGVGIFGF